MYSIKCFFTRLFCKKFYRHKTVAAAIASTYNGKVKIAVDEKKKIYKISGGSYDYIIDESFNILENITETKQKISDAKSESEKCSLYQRCKENIDAQFSMEFEKDDDSKYTTKDVSSQEEFLDCINNGNYININLTGNIILDTPVDITAYKHFKIAGNGYDLVSVQKEGTIQGDSYLYKMTSGSYKPEVSKMYTAESRVLNEDGSNVIKGTTTSQVYKFKLPEELVNMKPDNTYINFSCGWTAYTVPVVKVEDGYLYFNYTTREAPYCPDSDWYSATVPRQFTTFYVINGHLADEVDYDYIISETCITMSKWSYLDISNTNIFGNIVVDKSTLFIQSSLLSGNKYNAIYDKNSQKSVKTNISVTNTIFTNCARACVYAGIYSRCLVETCSFFNVNEMRKNYGAITCRGSYLIRYNAICNFGYCGINVGKVTCIAKIEEDCEVVENNNLWYADEYVGAEHCVNDSGAIYIGVNNTNAIIRNNQITDYIGKGYNNGIYCDDGCYNVTVANNIVAGKSNCYSISARYAYTQTRGYACGTDNTNKYIYNNDICNGIYMGGKSDIEQNSCFLGYNLIRNQSMENCFNGPIQEMVEPVVTKVSLVLV